MRTSPSKLNIAPVAQLCQFCELGAESMLAQYISGLSITGAICQPKPGPITAKHDNPNPLSFGGVIRVYLFVFRREG